MECPDLDRAYGVVRVTIRRARFVPCPAWVEAADSPCGFRGVRVTDLSHGTSIVPPCNRPCDAFPIQLQTNPVRIIFAECLHADRLVAPSRTAVVGPVGREERRPNGERDGLVEARVGAGAVPRPSPVL